MTGFAVFLSIIASIAIWSGPAPIVRNGQMLTGQQAQKTVERERERKAVREQFSQNFRELQLLGIDLLKTHEQRILRPDKLSKDAKAIQKRAKTLRGLTVLGEPGAGPEDYASKLGSADQFDRSIRELSRLIYRFAHNPIHKNSKVFDTDLAAQASSDLVNIINLAKIIEDNANGYIAAAK